MSNYAQSIHRVPRTLTDREASRLLRVTGEHVNGFRDHLILALALGTGLRQHEIVALNVGDIFDPAGRARRHVTLRVFKGSARDLAPQQIVLPDALRAKLEKFYRQKSKAKQALDPSAPLFVSRKSNRLSTRQVRHAFAVWQERAALERHHTFHTTRHTACTSIYRRTRDLRLTQEFARHRAITSTMLYTHPSDEDVVRAVQDQPC